MDITGLSVAGFSVILLVLWLVIALWTVSLFRKIYVSAQPSDENDAETFSVWQKHHIGIVVWLVALVAVIYYTNHESAYRPKTVIANPAQYQLEAEMQKVDEAELPKIKPAQPMTPMDGDAKDALEANDASNAAAREAFEKLE